MRVARIRFKLTTTLTSIAIGTACDTAVVAAIASALSLTGQSLLSHRYRDRDANGDVFAEMLYQISTPYAPSSTLTAKNYLLRALLTKVTDGSLSTSLQSSCSGLSAVHSAGVSLGGFVPE